MPFNSKFSRQKMIAFYKEVTITPVTLGGNMLAHTFKFNAILGTHAVNNNKNLKMNYVPACSCYLLKTLLSHTIFLKRN